MAFMGLKNAYERVQIKPLQHVARMYVEGGKNVEKKKKRKKVRNSVSGLIGV